MSAAGFIGCGTLHRRRRNSVSITAAVTPVMAPLADGQSIQDVSGWATFLSLANYAAPGNVVSVTPVFTGDASSASDPLSEGETAGFVIVVTDDLSNERTFNAGSTTIPLDPPEIAAIADQVIAYNTDPITLDFAANVTTADPSPTLEFLGLPAGVTDNGDGSITFPRSSAIASTTVTFRVTDADDQQATEDFALEVLVIPAPTVAVTPASATISVGTLAGSVVATVTLGGGAATPTLSGDDADEFAITGTGPSRNLVTVNDAVIGSYDVTVDVASSGGSDSAAFSLTVEAVVETGLVMEVETTTPSESFTIPMRAGFAINATIEWGDTTSDLITTANQAEMTHTYATPGTHTIRISGSMTNIRFADDTVSAAKVRTVINLGALGWTELQGAYSDCTGLTAFDFGNTDVSAVTTVRSMFRRSDALTTINFGNAAFTSLTSAQTMCADCTVLADLPGMRAAFTNAPIETADESFVNCPALDGSSELDFSQIDITGLQNLGADFTGGLFDVIKKPRTIAQSVYEECLTNWAAQVTPGSVPAASTSFGFGDSVYGPSFEAARLTLIDNARHRITDAGNAPPEVAAAPALVVNSATQITATLPADPFGNGYGISNRALETRPSGGSWTQIATGLAAGASVPDSGLTASTLYEARAVYTNFGGTTEGTAGSATTDAAAAADTLEITALTWIEGTASDDPALDIEYTYNGSGTVTAYVATGTDPVTVSDPQIKAGSGGTNTSEFFNFTVTGGSDQDDMALTDETVNRVVVLLSDGTLDSAPAEVVATFPTTVPSAFAGADWSVATGSAANELDITITSLPSDGGAVITDIEYDIDASGTWISLATANPGTVTVTMASPGTSYALRLRSVNSQGNADPGNSESATSGAASSPLAGDPGAIFCHSPDNINVTGSTFNAWPDNASGADGTYDLTAVPNGAAAPAWNAAESRLEFASGNPNAVISPVLATTPVETEVIQNGNTLIWMAVVDIDTSPESREFMFGLCANAGNNNSFTLGWDSNPGPVINVALEGRGTGQAYGSNFTSFVTNTTVNVGKHLIEKHLTPTAVEIWIDGVLEYSAATVPANYPTGNARLCLGARAEPTGTSRPANGKVYEDFMTTSIGNIAALRADLQTRHGLI